MLTNREVEKRQHLGYDTNLEDAVDLRKFDLGKYLR